MQTKLTLFSVQENLSSHAFYSCSDICCKLFQSYKIIDNQCTSVQLSCKAAKVELKTPDQFGEIRNKQPLNLGLKVAKVYFSFTRNARYELAGMLSR